jgi:hypothetical protein
MEVWDAGHLNIGLRRTKINHFDWYRRQRKEKKILNIKRVGDDSRDFTTTSWQQQKNQKRKAVNSGGVGNDNRDLDRIFCQQQKIKKGKL